MPEGRNVSNVSVSMKAFFSLMTLLEHLLSGLTNGCSGMPPPPITLHWPSVPLETHAPSTAPKCFSFPNDIGGGRAAGTKVAQMIRLSQFVVPAM